MWWDPASDYIRIEQHGLHRPEARQRPLCYWVHTTKYPLGAGTAHPGQTWYRLFIEIVTSEIMTVTIVSLTKGAEEIFGCLESCLCKGCRAVPDLASWQIQIKKKPYSSHSALFVPWELSWVLSSGGRLLKWHCVLMKFAGNEWKTGSQWPQLFIWPSVPNKIATLALSCVLWSLHCLVLTD